MPFELQNSAQMFERFIDHIICDLPFVCTYIDNLLVASHTPQKYKQHIWLLFTHLTNYCLIINVKKGLFGVPELDFLSHLITPDGIQPLPFKVQAVHDFPCPTTQQALQEFLGLVNFHARFIPHCASLLRPLASLLATRKNSTIMLHMNVNAETAFMNPKTALETEILLAHPHTRAPTNLITDASETAVVAILQQFLGKTWQTLAFFSQRLTHPRGLLYHFRPCTPCHLFSNPTQPLLP